MEVACLILISHLAFRMLIFKNKPPWHLLKKALIWSISTSSLRQSGWSSENTFCLFIPLMSCLHARAHLTLKRTHQQFSGKGVQCLHLGPSLRWISFFSSLILNSAYIWTPTNILPGLLHEVGIQIGCQVIKIPSHLDRIAITLINCNTWLRQKKKYCEETLVDLILFHGQRQMTGLF